jgi:hypothetical protein
MLTDPQLVYLFLVYVQPADIAPLIGFTGATMTLSKTLLYFLQEYFCGFCAVGHNDTTTILAAFIAPNA